MLQDIYAALIWLYATWPRDVNKAVRHTPCRVHSGFIAPSENIVSILK